MRSALIALTFFSATLTAYAGPYAPHEYDFEELRGLETSAFGIVESVREFSSRQEVVVRLEDGREVIVVQESASHIHPGERVRLVGNGRRLQLERS